MEALEDTTGENPYARLTAHGPLLQGDIRPVDARLPGGAVITATHRATAEWVGQMGGHVIGEIVPVIATPHNASDGQV